MNLLKEPLSIKGREAYLGLLREAIEGHDPSWFAEQLASRGYMNPIEVSHSKKGTLFVKRTPFSDQETLGFGEFNRYYIRGLCLRAIAESITHVVVYRALEVNQERAESISRIGQQINPTDLLADLRENIGRPTRFGVPGGPNSGISVKFP